jgi:hypothetical protein
VEEACTQGGGELGGSGRGVVDRFPKSQWKSLCTTHAIERLKGEFRRRVKTQSSLPGARAAERWWFGLILSGQIPMRRIDGWRDLKQISPWKAA